MVNCNEANCTCKMVNCVRHGKCCECINHHRGQRENRSLGMVANGFSIGKLFMMNLMGRV